MLNKLVKYDLYSCFKGVIVFYVLAFIFSSLTRIFYNIDGAIYSIIASICSGTYVAMIANIIINNIIRLVVKFKQNFYGDESYLTHTLPVTKNKLYLSKVLSCIISLFLSFIVITITLFIAYYSKENLNLVKELITGVSNGLNISNIKLILMFIFVILIEFINLIQFSYTGIILGYRMNHNKILYSFIFGFLSYTLSQVLIVVLVFILGLFNSSIMNLFTANEISNISVFNTLLNVCLVGYLLIFIINYIFNIKKFNKGVNVE